MSPPQVPGESIRNKLNRYPSDSALKVSEASLRHVYYDTNLKSGQSSL